MPANNAQATEERITSLDIAPPDEQLNAAIDKIKEAKRPVIIVGHEAHFQMGKIIDFAEQLNCAVMRQIFKGKEQ